MMAGPGPMELLILMMMSGGLFSSGGMLGMPPGERDAALVKCPPADSVIYVEWSSRSFGKPGAPGIDGLAADPEIQLFIKNLDQSIRTLVEQETANGQPEEQILGKVLPPLIKSLLVRPGCLYADLDAKAVVKLKEEDGPELQSFAGMVMAGLRATLIINAGKDADAMTKQIEQLLDLVPPQLAIERTQNLQRQKIPLPLPGGQLTVHRHKNYLIVGYGKGTIDTAIAGLTGKSKGLTSNKRFTAAMKRVAMERTGGVTWVDVNGLVTKVSQALGAQGAMIAGMAKMTGVDAIDSIASCTGVVDGQITTKNYVITGGRTDGVLSLFSGRAIKSADFSQIPADADFVLAGSLSAPKILDAVRDIVGKADPQSKEFLEATLQQLEDELGVSFDKDVFQAFGDLWTVYDSPSAGGVLLSAPVLALEIRDAKKANMVFTQLMKVFKDALPGEYGGGRRRRGVFLAQSIFYVNTVGNDVPVAPSFCLTEKQLIVTLHPQTLKAHLRFLAAKEKSFAARVGKELKLPEGELLSLTYFDTKSLVRYLYAMAPYFGQIMFSKMQQEGFPMDVFSLPSARAILPYVGTSLSATVRTKDGILVDSQSALPIPGGSSIILSLSMQFLGMRTIRLGQNFEVPRLRQPRVVVPIVGRAKTKPVKAPEVRLQWLRLAP